MKAGKTIVTVLFCGVLASPTLGSTPSNKLNLDQISAINDLNSTHISALKKIQSGEQVADAEMEAINNLTHEQVIVTSMIHWLSLDHIEAINQVEITPEHITTIRGLPKSNLAAFSLLVSLVQAIESINDTGLTTEEYKNKVVTEAVRQYVISEVLHDVGTTANLAEYSSSLKDNTDTVLDRVADNIENIVNVFQGSEDLSSGLFDEQLHPIIKELSKQINKT